jgi:hypothetical protein
MILVWSCPGNMLIYYPGLIDILPSPAVFGRVICLSDLDNILAYYLDKTFSTMCEYCLHSVSTELFPESDLLCYQRV